jgi:beta-barrel assembly-enhancing protease
MRYFKNFVIVFILLFWITPSFGISVSANPVESLKQDKISQKYGVTIDEEKEIGFQSAIYLMKKYGLYKNNEVNSYITRIGESIAKKVSKRPEIQYRFIVLDTNEVNAFAAPGGFVFITKGTLKALYNEAELTAVLSHEIAHIEDGHGLEAIFNDSENKGKISIIRQVVNSNEGLDQNFEKLLDRELNIR